MLLRLACLCTAAGSIAWSVSALRALPGDSGAVEHVADRLARGESYDFDALSTTIGRLKTSIANTCDARFLTESLIIEAKAVDVALQEGRLGAVDAALGDVGMTSARLVHCAPTASFGWVGLYWLRSVRDGYDAKSQSLLRTSYDLGRREIWIAVRRNPLALAVFDELTPELQDIAVDEFVDIIRAVELDQAAFRFVRLDGPLQRRIIARMDDVADGVRYAFFLRLRRLGFYDVPDDRGRRRGDQPWLN